MRTLRGVALIGICVLVVTSCSTGASSTRPPASRDVTDPSGPLCLGTEHTTLPKASAEQSFQVLVPNTDVASTKSVADVCAARGGGIAILFDSGVVLRESRNDLADPSNTWSGIAAANPDAGYRLGSIRGQDALIADPGGPLKLLGLVEWVEHGVKFKITGDGSMPTASLNQVAGSLRPMK